MFCRIFYPYTETLTIQNDLNLQQNIRMNQLRNGKYNRQSLNNKSPGPECRLYCLKPRVTIWNRSTHIQQIRSAHFKIHLARETA